MNVWIVDAFTEQAYHGNPAGVVIVDEFPADSVCQKIAAEINLSETAFVKPLTQDKFHLRWFTPAVEVKLCGHATLATSKVLFEEGLVQGNKITYDSLSGPLYVERELDNLSLNFPLQKTGPALDFHEVEATLKITGVINAVKAYDDLLIELADPQSIVDLVLDPADIMKVDCRGLIITARAHATYDFISRFFAPRVGVNEDPVTGSAHCKLAHYWQQKLQKNDLLAYQASKRGGSMQIKIINDRVLLTSQAVIIMQGVWKAPV